MGQVERIKLKLDMYNLSRVDASKMGAQEKQKLKLDRYLMLDKMAAELEPFSKPMPKFGWAAAGTLGIGALCGTEVGIALTGKLNNIDAITMVCAVGAIGAPLALYEMGKTLVQNSQHRFALNVIKDFKRGRAHGLDDFNRLWRYGYSEVVCLIASLGDRRARQSRYWHYLHSKDYEPADPWMLHGV